VRLIYIHLVAGHAPMVRAQTVMTPLDMPILSAEDMWRVLASITNEHQRKHFEQHLDLDYFHIYTRTPAPYQSNRPHTSNTRWH